MEGGVVPVTKCGCSRYYATTRPGSGNIPFRRSSRRCAVLNQVTLRTSDVASCLLRALLSEVPAKWQ